MGSEMCIRDRTKGMPSYVRRQPVRALFYGAAAMFGLVSSEYCPLGGNKEYPSIGKRLREMKKWEEYLREQAPSVD